MIDLTFCREGEISGAVRLLIEEHLSDMLATSPKESVHALPAAVLTTPGIELWSAWEGDALAGIGALSDRGELGGELKSMRVASTYRGRGVGRAVLRHLVARAHTLGYAALWLETGTEDAFLPARTLYLSEGFAECPPFPPYVPDPHSVFMTRSLTTP